MHRILLLIVISAICSLATFSCRAPHEEGAQHEGEIARSSTQPNLPLLDIMQGLEADLAGIAHGIWTRDSEAVRIFAVRIAEHPKVTPEQLLAIKDELGSEFGVFAQHDKVVHDTAVELATAVDSSANAAALFDIYRRIEQGCMSCHTAFQTRVSEALRMP